MLWIRRFPEDLLGGRPTYEQETRQVERAELPLIDDLPDFIGNWLQSANEVRIVTLLAFFGINFHPPGRRRDRYKLSKRSLSSFPSSDEMEANRGRFPPVYPLVTTA